MGVPKFFKWLIERYPLIMESVKDNTMPSIDNFFIDVNGIIHMVARGECSDMNDVYVKVFEYIEMLFNAVNPNALLFIAMDGVAPRAKLNNQRERRFESVRKSENSSKQKLFSKSFHFDTNSITPGTEFMKDLAIHIRYFIRKKIKEDDHWKNIKIIFSSSEVPGEGEHKIMEYLRHNKPKFNNKQSHCIYGADADLIFLSLATHEPYICLIRENLEMRNNFNVVHISLLREYIEIEFEELKETLNFNFCIENIIDDIVLFSMILGNDFIPNLPYLSIDKSLYTLFLNYKKILPTLDGYLMEKGKPNFKRLFTFLDNMNIYENKILENMNYNYNLEEEEDLSSSSDSSDENINTLEINESLENNESLNDSLDKLIVNPNSLENDLENKEINGSLDNVNVSFDSTENINGTNESRENINSLDNDDENANELPSSLNESGDNVNDNSDNLKTVSNIFLDGEDNDNFDKSNESFEILNKANESLSLNDSGDNINSSGDILIEPFENVNNYTDLEDEFLEKYGVNISNEVIMNSNESIELLNQESNNNIDTNRKSSKLINLKIKTENNDQETIDETSIWKMLYPTDFEISESWKLKYYYRHFDKTEFQENKSFIARITKSYLEGLLWVSSYYYYGCPSWSWFYPYHFSPLLADLLKSSDYDITFTLSEPFQPFLQLLSVLPIGSLYLLPKKFKSLVVEDKEMKVFYPEKYKIVRKYGNKANSVILPFIDEKLFKEKTKDLFNVLDSDECERNSFKEHEIYSYDVSQIESYSTTLPHHKDIENVHSKVEKIKNFITHEDSKYSFFLKIEKNIENVPGFPTFKSLTINGKVIDNREKCNLFISIKYNNSKYKPNFFNLIKRTCNIWPYNREYKITGLEDFNYIYKNSNYRIKKNDFEMKEMNQIIRFWQENRIQPIHQKLVYAKPLLGILRERNGYLRKIYSNTTEKIPFNFVLNEANDNNKNLHSNIDDEYELNSRVICTYPVLFGNLCQVIGHKEINNTKYIKIDILENTELKTLATEIRTICSSIKEEYVSINYLSKILNVPFSTILKITGTVKVKPGNYNLGIKIKYSGRNEKLLGYAKRIIRNGRQAWYFSNKTVDILKNYKEKFPEVFDLLERKSKSVFYTIEDLFQHSDESIILTEDQKNKFLELMKWLHSLPCNGSHPVPCDYIGIEKEVVDTIDTKTQELKKIKNDLKDDHYYYINSDYLLKPIKRNEFCNVNVIPHYNYGIETKERDFHLGDRVINLRNSGALTFGLRGTVIGIHGSNIDIIVDSEINDHKKKIKTVPKGSVLNVSQYLFTKKRQNHNIIYKGLKKNSDEDLIPIQLDSIITINSNEENNSNENKINDQNHTQNKNNDRYYSKNYNKRYSDKSYNERNNSNEKYSKNKYEPSGYKKDRKQTEKNDNKEHNSNDKPKEQSPNSKKDSNEVSHNKNYDKYKNYDKNKNRNNQYNRYNDKYYDRSYNNSNRNHQYKKKTNNSNDGRPKETDHSETDNGNDKNNNDKQQNNNNQVTNNVQYANRPIVYVPVFVPQPTVMNSNGSFVFNLSAPPYNPNINNN